MKVLVSSLQIWDSSCLCLSLNRWDHKIQIEVSVSLSNFKYGDKSFSLTQSQWVNCVLTHLCYFRMVLEWWALWRVWWRFLEKHIWWTTFMHPGYIFSYVVPILKVSQFRISSSPGIPLMLLSDENVSININNKNRNLNSDFLLGK